MEKERCVDICYPYIYHGIPIYIYMIYNICMCVCVCGCVSQKHRYHADPCRRARPSCTGLILDPNVSWGCRPLRLLRSSSD